MHTSQTALKGRDSLKGGDILQSDSDPIGEIRNRLKRWPQLPCETGDGWLSVHSEHGDGFSVSFAVTDGEYVVSFDGWHEHFTDVDDALKCFVFGLTDAARPKVFSRGGVDYKGILEHRENGKWTEESTTGRLFFPFWGRRRVRCLQNRIIDVQS